MSLAPTKYEILKTMLLYDRSLRPIQIAKEIGKEFPSVMMHIIGLTRMGYTNSPEKGYYIITKKGKRACGIPEIDREKAKKILATRVPGEFFHFYTSIGKSLEIYANGLQDFYEKLLAVNLSSIEFHMNRGDFETWFAGLGDIELAKKVALLKEKKKSGEVLRDKLVQIVENRCRSLAKDAEPVVISE